MPDPASQLEREWNETDEMYPAVESIEELARHAAQIINKLESGRPVSKTELTNALNRCLRTCEALERLYSKASQSDKDRATEILNQ